MISEREDLQPATQGAPSAAVGFDGLVCDLDGVLYRGNEPVPGAAEAIGRLRADGVKVVFCTNNSRPTLEELATKLERFGVSTAPNDILSSAAVTAETLVQRGLSDATAIVVGGAGLETELTRAGIHINEDPSSIHADLVVVGIDISFDYNAMRRASMAVRAGAKLIATNDDSSFPAADGLWPGSGALVASIETASGAEAEVMGKPHPPMMEAAARRLEGAEHIAVVGDRPDTDLAGGVSRGWTTILVLSGVTTADEAETCSPKPDFVIPSLAHI